MPASEYILNINRKKSLKHVRWLIRYVDVVYDQQKSCRNRRSTAVQQPHRCIQAEFVSMHPKPLGRPIKGIILAGVTLLLLQGSTQAGTVLATNVLQQEQQDKHALDTGRNEVPKYSGKLIMLLYIQISITCFSRRLHAWQPACRCSLEVTFRPCTSGNLEHRPLAAPCKSRSVSE